MKAPHRCMFCGELGGELLVVKGSHGFVWTLAQHPECGAAQPRPRSLGPKPKIDCRRNADGSLTMVRP